MDKEAFCAEVDRIVETMYDLMGGGSLCYNLLESGVINASATPNQAAAIVAQHLIQA